MPRSARRRLAYYGLWLIGSVFWVCFAFCAMLTVVATVYTAMHGTAFEALKAFAVCSAWSAAGLAPALLITFLLRRMFAHERRLPGFEVLPPR
jgi:hypothetical protein